MSDGRLNYLMGLGWLVFSGGNIVGSEIRAQAITRAKAYGTTVYISLADDGGDSLMDDMEDLGARSGYFVELEYESPEDVLNEIQDASLIMIEIGSSLDKLYNVLNGAAIEGIRSAYMRGAVVVLEGLTGNLFGRWFIDDSGDIRDGFNWVQQSFIEPQSHGIDDSRAVQAILSSIPDAIAINIAEGSALALGAGGQVEIWGTEQNVTISLGRSFTD